VDNFCETKDKIGVLASAKLRFLHFALTSTFKLTEGQEGQNKNVPRKE